MQLTGDHASLAPWTFYNMASFSPTEPVRHTNKNLGRNYTRVFLHKQLQPLNTSLRNPTLSNYPKKAQPDSYGAQSYDCKLRIQQLCQYRTADSTPQGKERFPQDWGLCQRLDNFLAGTKTLSLDSNLFRTCGQLTAGHNIQSPHCRGLSALGQLPAGPETIFS